MNLPTQLNTAIAIEVTDQVLSPHVDDDEARELATSIDLSSALGVSQFGQQVGEMTSQYADKLLAEARADDIDDIGGKLNEIVVAAQSFDLSSFDSKWARAPLVGGLVRSYVLTKEKAVARFTDLETQVDKLIDNIHEALSRLEQRSASFEAMYEGVSAEHNALATHVRAAEIALEDLDSQIAKAGKKARHLASAEKLGALEASRHALAKRADNLRVLQHSALQTLPMIRMMQANNLVLLEKFQTIQRLTLPAWKRTFVMALALNEQREAVKLAESIDDATNYFMRRNSEILHENTLETAKANQRTVVDVETLREVHQNVIKTLSDVRKVHRDGTEKRREALEQLVELRSEMAQGLAGILPEPEEDRDGGDGRD